MPLCWFRLGSERFRLRLSALVNYAFRNGLVSWDGYGGHGHTPLEHVNYSTTSWFGWRDSRQNRPGRNRSNSLLFGNSPRERHRKKLSRMGFPKWLISDFRYSPAGFQFSPSFVIRRIKVRAAQMTNGDYAKQWKKMRQIHFRALLAIVIGPAAMLVGVYVFQPPHRFTTPFWIFWWTYCVFLAWTMHQYRTWPCPRCGLPWQGGWLSAGFGVFFYLFPKHACRHCGLQSPKRFASP